MGDSSMDHGRRMHGLLHGMIEAEASDLHLVPGYRPTYRVHGRLQPAESVVLGPDVTRALIEAVLPAPALQRLTTTRNIDCSVTLPIDDAAHRFRANVFFAQGALCACFRHVPDRIPAFDWLGFPRVLAEEIVHLVNGLVIVTGVTGSGKTTSLAAMVNLLVAEGGYRIITVEEPVEYLFERTEQTVVTQREVGTDVDSFYDGLKYGLRQDPNVVLVGEIRDRDTAQMALSAAETGHLILTTMHTRDAKGAVTRFVDLFPHDAQEDVRTQLALSLRHVVSQHLLPSINQGDKRVLALEILKVNDAVRSAIYTGKIASIDTAMQTGRRDGLVTIDESLEQLLRAGRISRPTATRHAKDRDRFLGTM